MAPPAGQSPEVLDFSGAPGLRALDRERLRAVFGRVAEHRLTLVTGPAGAGKTTLLRQLVERSSTPVAWHRMEPGDGSLADFLLRLELTATLSFADLRGGWRRGDDVSDAFRGWRGAGGTIIVDDLHVVDGSGVDRVLLELAATLPDHVRMVVASRCTPAGNLSALRAAGELLEIDGDDLRFRTWEVEELFTKIYGDPLSPDAAALLSRRTDGWAAGLQLFHLATAGRSASESRRLLAGLGARVRYVRDYLSENILDQLPAETRAFLLRTYPLGDHLTAALCDQLGDVGHAGASGATLAYLERRGVFTTEVDGLGTYRYHEVLRSHLDGTARATLGDAAVSECYRQAGLLLEREGAHADALLAFARAGDWRELSRVAGHHPLVGPAEWLDDLPPGVGDRDPLVLLARARRHVAEGALGLARRAYRQAAVALGPTLEGEAARHEATAVGMWCHHDPVPRSTWLGRLHGDVHHEVRCQAPPPGAAWGDHLSAGFAAWAQGDLEGARDALVEIDAAAAPQAAGLAARALLGARPLVDPGAGLGDGRAADNLRALADDADLAGLPWLARIARSLLAVTVAADGQDTAASVARRCEQIGDDWGAAVASLAAGVGSVLRGAPARDPLEAAVRCFDALGAAVPGAWARTHLAAAAVAAGAPDALALAAAAEAAARSAGATGARRLALQMRTTATAAPTASAPQPCLEVHCFGGFTIENADEVVDLTRVKPRARAVLRMLAASTPSWVHGETLLGAFWPDSDLAAGRHSLQVAVSSLRSALDAMRGDGRPSALERSDDAYRIGVGLHVEVDVRTFGAAMSTGRARRAAGDREGAISAFERALLLHRGDLLPEDGPAEWVVGNRERCRREAVSAALALAELFDEAGELRAAERACDIGLSLDPYADALWRQLLHLHGRAGDPAAAERTRRAYATVLADLGVAPA